MKNLFSFFVLFLSLIYNSTSFSATLCGNIRFWDERSNRDDNSKLLESTTGNRLVHEAKIWIYDMDGSCIDGSLGCTESEDQFITSLYTSSSGYFCITVPNNDDIYFVHKSENRYGSVKDDDTSTWSRKSLLLAENISGTVTVNWNLTCFLESDGLCNSQDQIDDAYSKDSDIIMILESLYDTADFFSDNNVLNINGINYPDGEEFTAYYQSPIIGGNTYCATQSGQCWNDHEFCISTSSSDNNHIIAHEMGHALQKRAFNITTDPYFLSSCPSSSWTGSGNGEKCVTSEGFANFVAGAVYWESDANSPWWNSTSQILEGNTTSGNSGISSACASINSSPEKIIANAARFFWDVFDETNIGTGENYLTDDSNLSFYDIVLEWDSFPNGTSNRQSKESGDDGRNIYDYEYYNSSVYSELDHNCLDNQTP